MSKQATHSAFPGLNGLSLEVGPLSNGWKDLTSGNAFDIRFPPPSDNYLSPQNIGALTDDVFNDSLPTKLLGGDLLKGIMSLGDDSNDGEDTFPKSSSSTSTSGALGQGFDNFWKNGASSANSEASLLRGCMTNSSTKPTGDYPSAFAHFSNNEGLGFLRRSSSFKDEQVTSTSGGNESSRTSSDPESPGGAEANPGSSSSDIAAPPSSQGSMGFIERAQLINQRINSNEGWGKKPIRQDTPWAVEGSMYGSRRDETEANQPQPQAQQPETTGPFWDQTARIANCSDSDRNFGVWSEPGRTSGSSGLSGLASTGVGVWKNNLGAKRVETPSGQPSWPPNPADPMAVLAACVANKLEDPAAKAPKWTSQPLLNSLSMASQLPGPQSVWDDIGKSNTNNQAYTPWNSGQRMMGNAPADGTTTDPNTILQLLAFTGSQKGLQGNEQKNDIFNNANKPYGFEGPRGRPLFPQKAHNPTPSPLPTQFPSFSFNNQPPQSRMDFSGQQLLPPNLYPGSAGQNNMFLANQQQENAQKLLLHLMQQQQQQQHQQQQHQGNNAELMMMMMADQSKLVPGMDKEVVLAHLLNNMRLEGKKDMPWHMQYQQPAAEIGNVWSGQPMGHVTQMMDDPSNLFMGGANNALFNSRLNSWQHNKQVPNTANLSYNWLLIKQFSGDIASLQLICQQNKAVVQFCSVNSNSVLIYFNSTDDSMKAKANLAMKNVPCDLLDNNTASQKLQEGVWTKMATIQHPSFLPMQGGNLPWGAGARF